MNDRFSEVTEIGGQHVSQEQLDRTCHRYLWAKGFAANKHVLEVACGSGPGLGVLRSVARHLEAGDVSVEVLDSAKATYGDSVSLGVFDAEHLPFEDSSFDLLLIFEAIYYLPTAEHFFLEARRVLKRGGNLLIVTANKDLFDFVPSPYSTRYFGVCELKSELEAAGFQPKFWGFTKVTETSLRQKVLRPAKYLASKLNVVPRTMHGKAFLKRIFFGKMTTMPADISKTPYNFRSPDEISSEHVNTMHKVIYCQAIKN